MTRTRLRRRLAPLVVAALFLSACGAKEDSGLAGYVEADLLYIAPQDGGALLALEVREGDIVETGAPLFRIDPARMALSLGQAEAAAAAAADRVSDEGALAQQTSEAEARFENARRQYQRSAELLKEGVVTRARVDDDRAAFEAAEARRDGAKAEREAAARDAGSARALADLWRRRLDDLEVRAPAAGSIERIYRRAGEIVAAGDPVLALLPPGGFKIRFFAPEAMLSGLRPGGEVLVDCGRCPETIRARITYVAAEPQFTPPVIYSVDEREKLVFLVEARPESGARLTPGLPVTVRPAEAP